MGGAVYQAKRTPVENALDQTCVSIAPGSHGDLINPIYPTDVVYPRNKTVNQNASAMLFWIFLISVVHLLHLMIVVNVLVKSHVKTVRTHSLNPETV